MSFDRQSLTNEQRFLLAALRIAALNAVPNSPDRPLIEGPVNWEVLLELAAQNQVIPLLHRASKRTAALPREVARRIAARARITANRNALLAHELLRLSSVFEAMGIQVISYKGPTAARLLYGDVGLRAFGDMDFLVKRDDLARVCDRLMAEGYQPSDGEMSERELFEREQKEYLFKRGAISLEPHWSITARRFPFEIDYDGLWARARPVELAGGRVLTFAPEDLLLILCVCGAKARWERLQMVVDVARAVRTFEHLDWDACIERAEASGAGRMLGFGLHLARELLDVELPPVVVAWVERDRVIPRLTSAALAMMLAPRRTNPWTRQGAWIFSSTLFRLRERRIDRWRYLVRSATTPREIHLKRFPFARWFFPAYYLLVPLHDYVLVPAAWIARGRWSDGDESWRP